MGGEVMHVLVRISRLVGVGAFLAASTAVAFPLFGGRALAACVGDCNGDGSVTVDEILTMVNIALGNSQISDCLPGDANGDSQITIDEILTAVNNALAGCAAGGTPTVTPTATPTVEDKGLGKRMFSIRTGTSSSRCSRGSSCYSIVGLPIKVETSYAAGFLELEAGPRDPATGLRPIRVTNASEFISIWLVPTLGTPSAICIKPVIESFPVENAGYLACEGYENVGVTLTQDHNRNDEDPQCLIGTPDLDPRHQGVCNGPVFGAPIAGNSAPGGLYLGPDLTTGQGGLRMEAFVLSALPCRDDLPGTSRGVSQWVLTTGLERATILDRDNSPGDTLEAEAQGVNFSCDEWTKENGPGTLVFAGPALDQPIPGFSPLDLIYVFTLAD
jgi:hypothetical protein